MIGLELLLLLLIANGAPILARLVCGRTRARPIDNGYQLPDGYPLFGSAKTWRGLLASAAACTLAALAIGWSGWLGLLIASSAMLGDLLSSFVKRRLGMPASSKALGLDQIPESLLPLLLCQGRLGLSFGDILGLVVVFFFLDLLLSRLAYHIGIRRRPY